MSEQRTLDGEACALGIALVQLFAKYPAEDRMGLLMAWHQAAVDALTETVIEDGPYAPARREVQAARAPAGVEGGRGNRAR